jgi:hypothetical protein
MAVHLEQSNSRHDAMARLVALVLAACAIVLAMCTTAAAQPTTAERPRETLVKAAFLHKFFSFVEWPEGTFARPDSPVRIGVLGDDEILDDLLELSKDRVRDGRPVTAVRVVPGESLAGVHILYLKIPSSARMADVLSTVPEGVLTVADAESAHPKGSVMSFFVEEGRVRFGLSLEAAARQRLRLSSRLLSVARKIQGSLEAVKELAWHGRAGPAA